MNEILRGSILTTRLWYVLPLIVAISLVYAATRHEIMKPILRHAVHTAVWIAGFILIVFVVLFGLSWTL